MVIEVGLRFFEWVFLNFGPLNGVLLCWVVYEGWQRHLEAKAHDLSLERMLAMQNKFAEVQLAQASVLAELRLLLTPSVNRRFPDGTQSDT